jgi:hypothetical protein
MTSVRAVFVSDVHLGTRACQAERLLEFLKAYESEYLYLLGEDGAVGIGAAFSQVVCGGHDGLFGGGVIGGVPFGIDAGGAIGQGGDGDMLGGEFIRVGPQEIEAGGVEVFQRREARR